MESMAVSEQRDEGTPLPEVIFVAVCDKKCPIVFHTRLRSHALPVKKEKLCGKMKVREPIVRLKHMTIGGEIHGDSMCSPIPLSTRISVDGTRRRWRA